jgi:hypothetical protein
MDLETLASMPIINLLLIFGNKIDASRITLGINFGFEPKQFYSEIRLNYENYFKSSLPIHTDKFTIEFIGRF